MQVYGLVGQTTEGINSQMCFIVGVRFCILAYVDTLYNFTIVYPYKILGQLVKGQGHYGASVAEWLESLTYNHLPLTDVGSNLTRDLDLSC